MASLNIENIDIGSGHSYPVDVMHKDGLATAVRRAGITETFYRAYIGGQHPHRVVPHGTVIPADKTYSGVAETEVVLRERTQRGKLPEWRVVSKRHVLDELGRSLREHNPFFVYDTELRSAVIGRYHGNHRNGRTHH